jgi:hypothetical protein
MIKLTDEQKERFNAIKFEEAAANATFERANDIHTAKMQKLKRLVREIFAELSDQHGIDAQSQPWTLKADGNDIVCVPGIVKDDD